MAYIYGNTRTPRVAVLPVPTVIPRRLAAYNSRQFVLPTSTANQAIIASIVADAKQKEKAKCACGGACGRIRTSRRLGYLGDDGGDPYGAYFGTDPTIDPGIAPGPDINPMPADAINIIQSSGVPFGPQPTAATIAQNAAAGLQPGGPNLFSSIAQALASVGGAAVTAGLRPGYPSNLPQPGTLGYSLSQPVPGLGISYGWVIGGAAGLVFLLMLTKRR